MPSLNDYLPALKDAVSEERYHFALDQLKMAWRELNENRTRELEFAVSAGERLNLLNNWFGDFLTKEVKNTLALLAEERKLSLLNEIKDDELGEAIVVTTARPMSQPIKEWFMKELEMAFVSARAIFKTDSSLIGGIKIRAGDREVDNSLLSKLKSLL